MAIPNIGSRQKCRGLDGEIEIWPIQAIPVAKQIEPRIRKLHLARRLHEEFLERRLR